MYPNVFITEAFLDDLSDSEQKVMNLSLHDDDSEKENQYESCKRIRNLLLSSNLKCTIKDSRLIKFYKIESGKFSDLKSLIIHRAIKDNRLSNHNDSNGFADKNTAYFIDNYIDECNILSDKNGVIVTGKNFISKPFFLNHSINREDTDYQVSQLNKAIHSCSGMIIIDPFIFIDDQRRTPKIPNLIELLKKFINKGLKAAFELDIITKNPQNNQLVESKIEQLFNAFDLNRLSIHVYAPFHFENESDRHFITNYSLYSIGHPLDRSSFISGNFYPSCSTKEEVKKCFKQWKNKISNAKDLINNTPHNIGLIKCVWLSDQRKHSIFNCLKNERLF